MSAGKLGRVTEEYLASLPETSPVRSRDVMLDNPLASPTPLSTRCEKTGAAPDDASVGETLPEIVESVNEGETDDLTIPPEAIAMAQRLLQKVHENRARQQRAGDCAHAGEVAAHAAADALEDVLSRARERGLVGAPLSDVAEQQHITTSTARKWRVRSVPRSERSKRGAHVLPERLPSAQLEPAGPMTYEAYVAGPTGMMMHESNVQSSSCLLDLFSLGQCFM